MLSYVFADALSCLNKTNVLSISFKGEWLFLQCCGQITGCGQYVQTWFEENDICPLWRDANGVEKVIHFQGLGDVLKKKKDLDLTPLDG